MDIERLRQVLAVRKEYEDTLKILKDTRLTTADDVVVWRRGSVLEGCLPDLLLKQVINYGLRALLSETEKQMADVDSTIRDLAKGD